MAAVHWREALSATFPTALQMLYKAPFTGSASRTQHLKNSDIISAKDFNAVGNGIADDTTPVDNAVLAAGTIAKVYLPCPGAYHTTNRGDLACTPIGGGAAASAASCTTDANDLLVYKLDESASPWANSGASGANNLALIAGNTSRWGLFKTALGGFGRALSYNGNANERSQGAAGVEPVLPITISMWLFPGTASGTNVWSKLYRLDATAWAAPFISMGISTDSNLIPVFQLTTGAVLTTVTSNANLNDRCRIGEWCYIAGTYDGSTMRLYLNGIEVSNAAKVGAIDYGSHGPWSTGQSPAGGGTFVGLVDDLRVANVLRPASWFESCYANAQR